MEAVIQKTFNELPMKTYRWLKVNEFRLPQPLVIPVKPYAKTFYQQQQDESGIMLQPITKAETVKSDLLDYTSSEIIELCQTAANAGVYLRIPAKRQVSKPIKIEYNLDKHNNSVIERNVIIAEQDSHATVIFVYGSDDEDTCGLHTGTTEIYVEPGAVLNIIKIQCLNDLSYHFDLQVAKVQDSAQVNYIQAELGSSLVVTNHICSLTAQASTQIDAVYFGDKERHIELSYIVNHLGKRSNSRIDTHGVLKDKAEKTFKGTLDFKRGASKAEGSEQENVILLNPTAKSHTVPLLLCSEEDVKGAHGASVGRVEQNQLFYLMSRGLNYTDALTLIVEAAFNPVLDRIADAELRQGVREFLHRRLESSE